jgi:uncharacterized protein (TIGR03086 family)
MDVFDAMDRSYQYTAGVVAGLRPEHATLPTPCPLFDVAGVYGHLVGVLDMFTAALTETPYTPRDDAFAGDMVATYTAAATTNRAAWQRCNEATGLDTMITLPFGTVPAAMSVNLNVIDVLVHGWDLATAVGLPDELPEDVANFALGFTENMLKPEMRSDAPDASFGPAVEVPADAPVGVRLVAFLGRQP